jgi:hypothetical protein
MGCTDNASWRAADLETSFLTFVSELPLSEILGSTDETEKTRLETESLNTTALLEDKKSQRERACEEMLRRQASTFLQHAFDKLDREVGALEKKSEELKERLLLLTAEAEATSTAQGEIISLIEQLRKLEGDEAFRARAAIAARIRELVECVVLRLGRRKKFDNTVPAYRQFLVRFKGCGHTRAVAPDSKDPTKVKVMVVTTDDGIRVEAADKPFATVPPVLRGWKAKVGKRQGRKDLSKSGDLEELRKQVAARAAELKGKKK